MTEAPRRRLRDHLAKTWSSSGTLIAVIASGVALTFQLAPSLAPDPGAGRIATIAIRTVEPGVTLPAFDAQFAPAMLKHDSVGDAGPGDVVWVSVDVKGEKHGSVSLYVVPYDWQTKRVANLDEATYQTSHNATGFDPGTPDDQWIAPLWVPNPGAPYFVRVMLEHDHVILAYADTGRIAAQ
jgi:hypothetical protein